MIIDDREGIPRHDLGLILTDGLVSRHVDVRLICGDLKRASRTYAPGRCFATILDSHPHRGWMAGLSIVHDLWCGEQERPVCIPACPGRNRANDQGADADA